MSTLDLPAFAEDQGCVSYPGSRHVQDHGSTFGALLMGTGVDFAQKMFAVLSMSAAPLPEFTLEAVDDSLRSLQSFAMTSFPAFVAVYASGAVVARHTGVLGRDSLDSFATLLDS